MKNLTIKEKQCLQEHLNTIDNSMAVIKSMLGVDLSERPLLKMSKAEQRENKYRAYIRNGKNKPQSKT